MSSEGRLGKKYIWSVIPKHFQEDFFYYVDFYFCGVGNG